MPNFALECPILIFLPFIIITAVAAIVGCVNLALLFATRHKTRRPVPDLAGFLQASAKPVLLLAVERQGARRVRVAGTALRQISTNSPVH